MKARIGAGFMIWLAAVVSVAGIAWLAIGTAGKQVTADPIAAPLPTEFPPSPSPTRTTAPGRTVEVDDVGPTSTRVGPTPGRSSRPVTTPPADRADRADSTEPTRRERPHPRSTPVTSTYSTSSGRLRVRCEGREITLDGGYAQPAPGWAVTVQSGGPDRIQVTFDTDKAAPVSVVAECGQGRPRFRFATMPAPAPATGGWRPQARPVMPTPAATPTTEPATTPPCAVPPSPVTPSATVTMAPETTPEATPETTPEATPETTPEATPAPDAFPTPSCPPVEAGVTPLPATPTPATAPDDDWVAREWAARTRS